MRFGFDCYRSADRIAIACLSAQTEGYRLPDLLHRVAQDPKLRRVAVFQDDFQSSILVQVSECKCSAVLKKIQSHSSRDFRKRAVMVVRVENIPLVPATSDLAQ